MNREFRKTVSRQKGSTHKVVPVRTRPLVHEAAPAVIFRSSAVYVDTLPSNGEK